MNETRFQQLFDAWSESRLSAAEAAELSALLRADPAACERFRAEAAFHGHLHAALDDLSRDRAAATVVPFPLRRSTYGVAAMLLAVGITAASLGWILSARADAPELRPLGIRDGGFDERMGRVPEGFPQSTFSWAGDPSEIAPGGGHPTALRFLEAAGEPNVPNSPSQSCDVFQVIDLKTMRTELLSSSEAFVELKAAFLDDRPSASRPVRFIAKVYAFEGSPETIYRNWPPASDQVIASGAQFHMSTGASTAAWKTVTARCAIPANAGFLVIQLGAGSAGRPGQAAPTLGEQYADDVRLTLHTRQHKSELAAR